MLLGTWSTISENTFKEDDEGDCCKKRFTSRVNIELAPHLIRIGIVQVLAGIVPVIRYIEMDGTHLDIRTRLSKPIMPLYRFLPGMLIGQCILRNIGLDRIMMIRIGDQIVI